MRTVKRTPAKINEANKYAAMFASLGSYQEIETKYKDLQTSVPDGEKSELDSAYQEAVATTVGEGLNDNMTPDKLTTDGEYYYWDKVGTGYPVAYIGVTDGKYEFKMDNGQTVTVDASELNDKITNQSDMSEGDKPDFLKDDEAKTFAEALLEAAEEAPFGGEDDKKAGFYKDEDKTLVFDNTANEMVMEEVADDEEAKDWLSKRGVTGDRKPEEGDSEGEVSTVEALHESYKGKPLPTLENYTQRLRKIKG